MPRQEPEIAELRAIWDRAFNDCIALPPMKHSPRDTQGMRGKAGLQITSKKKSAMGQCEVRGHRVKLAPGTILVSPLASMVLTMNRTIRLMLYLPYLTCRLGLSASQNDTSDICLFCTLPWQDTVQCCSGSRVRVSQTLAKGPVLTRF